MPFARMSAWKFKRGLREEALKAIDQTVGPAARATVGHRGGLFLFSADDPNAAVMITLWESEAALKASATGVFRDAAKGMEKFVAAPPAVKNYRVFGAELALTYGQD